MRSNDFNFNQCALGQRLHCHAGTSRLSGKVAGVDLVKRSKVSHVCQETGGFDYVLKGAACSLQHSADVLHHLLCLCGDLRLGQCAGSRIDGHGAGQKQQAASLNCLRVRADSSRSCRGGNDLIHRNASMCMNEIYFIDIRIALQ